MLQKGAFCAWKIGPIPSINIQKMSHSHAKKERERERCVRRLHTDWLNSDQNEPPPPASKEKKSKINFSPSSKCCFLYLFLCVKKFLHLLFEREKERESPVNNSCLVGSFFFSGKSPLKEKKDFFPPENATSLLVLSGALSSFLVPAQVFRKGSYVCSFSPAPIGRERRERIL